MAELRSTSTEVRSKGAHKAGMEGEVINWVSARRCRGRFPPQHAKQSTIHAKQSTSRPIWEMRIGDRLVGRRSWPLQ